MWKGHPELLESYHRNSGPQSTSVIEIRIPNRFQWEADFCFWDTICFQLQPSTSSANILSRWDLVPDNIHLQPRAMIVASAKCLCSKSRIFQEINLSPGFLLHSTIFFKKRSLGRNKWIPCFPKHHCHNDPKKTCKNASQWLKMEKLHSYTKTEKKLQRMAKQKHCRDNPPLGAYFGVPGWVLPWLLPVLDSSA